MSKIIGIDLGTSNSAAAVVEGGKPTMIPSAEGTVIGGGKAFPSYVAMTKEGELLVGEAARRQAVTNPENTVTAFKRKMGSKDKYMLSGKEYTPQQLSAFVLQKVKKDAEAFLGEPIQKAVITAPAYFSDSQRQATKDAGSIAGLEVVRIINEPTAASLAYGIDKAGKEEKILVFDLGGGTLDVTIMEIFSVESDEGNKESGFEVKSTSGDTELGGTDMDQMLVEYIVQEFKKESGIDLNSDKTALQRVVEGAEKAKIELSSTLETDINLPFISAQENNPKHLAMKITRAKLEELVKPVVDKCKGPMEQVLSDSKSTPNDITKIVMVGGPTRMPIVQKFVEDYIGKKIERGVDPMESVAIGAAIQGAALSGEIKDIQLLDVTPLTLGIETLGQVMTPLIERNTTIPTSKSQVFSTAADNQPAVDIHVLQGERPMSVDNRSLGKFILDGIPPAPRGVPQIEVSFDIDANGILNVKAKDKATNKEQQITVTDSSALSKEDIEKMKKEAETHATEDRQKKELIEIRNQADTLIFSTEKALKEAGDKVKPEDRKEVDNKLEELKKLKNSSEADKLKKAIEDLSQAIQKIGAQLYQKVEQEKAEQSEPEIKTETKENKEKTVEGEYEEVKEG